MEKNYQKLMAVLAVHPHKHIYKVKFHSLDFSNV